MLIRLQRCGSGFVLEAHSKSFHSSVQIQWGCYVSPALSGWISCFSSLVQMQTGASEGLLLWNSHSTKCGMALRFSSLPNMQCVLSSLYLISSAVTEMRACVCLHVCAVVVAFLSEKGQHNVSYFSLISFCISRASDRAALDIPIILLSRDVFFGMTHCRKSPKLHLSCSLKLSSLTVWPH